MSGPYCKACKHFYRPPLCPPDEGECHDPTKIIHSGAGNSVNEPPITRPQYLCDNWTELTGDRDGT